MIHRETMKDSDRTRPISYSKFKKLKKVARQTPNGCRSGTCRTHSNFLQPHGLAKLTLSCWAEAALPPTRCSVHNVEATRACRLSTTGAQVRSRRSSLAHGAAPHPVPQQPPRTMLRIADLTHRKSRGSTRRAPRTERGKVTRVKVV